ncbi:hypothetical protein [Paracoccus methylarcula]|uniref:hypothetical protein n=1 Tax=Paracoccus methylarcula TaxID=72022 RepID=UPI0014744466|nr:hypothetical protein [Paracoccus methylarcula]
MTDKQPASQDVLTQRRAHLATINDVLSIVSKLSFTGGFLAVVWYCCFAEGIGFPINSLSQAVSTFAVAFVLVLLLGLLIGVSYLVIQPALFLRAGFKRHSNGEQFWAASVDAWLLLVMGSSFAIVLAIPISMGWKAIGIPNLLLGATAVCGSGLLLHRLTAPRDTSLPLDFMLIAPGIILSLLLMTFGGQLIPAAMTALGIRSKPGQLVTIASDSHERVQALAKAEALTLEAEQIGKDQWLYPKATVLWSGLGGPATVKFTDERHDLRITLPEEDVHVSSIETRRPMRVTVPPAKAAEATPQAVQRPHASIKQ